MTFYFFSPLPAQLKPGAGVFIWNGSKDKNQFKNLEFYNNIVYNSKGAVMHYDKKESEHVGFRFYNNIFVAKDELVLEKDTLGTDVFLNNLNKKRYGDTCKMPG